MLAAEKAVARLLGVPNVVATATGSLAFDLILNTVDFEDDAEAVLPVFGWISVVASVRRRGLRPVLADLHDGPTTSLRQLLGVTTPRTRVWVITHMRGHVVRDAAAIRREADARGILLVEDCAQAWGAKIDGRCAGVFGHYAFFSTQSNKILAAGEGGFVVAHSEVLLESVRCLAGYDPGADLMQAGRQLNARMTEVTASTLLPQIRHLPRIVERLRATRNILSTELHTRSNLGSLQVWGDAAHGNSVTTAFLAASVDQARTLHDKLNAQGVAAYMPGGAGDRHNAAAWQMIDGPSVALLKSMTALPRYVDVPTPLMGSSRSREWARTIVDAAKEAV